MKSLKVTIMFVLALSLMSCNGCAGYQKYGLERPHVKANMIMPYLSSVALQSETGFIHGSGTILINKTNKEMVVITAAHVVRGFEEDQKDIYVKTNYDKNIRLMEVKKIDDFQDLAIIVSITPEEKDGPSAKIAKGPPNLGDDVYAIGCPRGVQGVITKGVLSHFTTEKYALEKNTKIVERQLYRFTADIIYGNSGGGLFNSKGYFIGVNVQFKFVMMPIVDLNDESISGDFSAFVPEPGAFYSVSLFEINKFFKK